ncbi:MAG: ribbon-helix-helix domain-containing protein [Promethearchaeota archaeon]
MKIVTVNIPESFIDVIEKLVGENGIYPSRSELIRCAVRDFLLKELQSAKDLTLLNEPEFEESVKDDKYVKIPIERIGENDEPIREFKTYKIIKRLEY